MTGIGKTKEKASLIPPVQDMKVKMKAEKEGREKDQIWTGSSPSALPVLSQTHSTHPLDLCVCQPLQEAFSDFHGLAWVPLLSVPAMPV